MRVGLVIVLVISFSQNIFGFGVRRGRAHHRRLLEPVDWNARTFDEPGVGTGPDIYGRYGRQAEDDQLSVARRVFLSNVKRRNTVPDDVLRKQDDARGRSLMESGAKKATNKWGFNQDCRVICKKTLCFGWGPPAEELCERGDYHHQCCDEFKPLTGSPPKHQQQQTHRHHPQTMQQNRKADHDGPGIIEFGTGFDKLVAGRSTQLQSITDHTIQEIRAPIQPTRKSTTTRKPITTSATTSTRKPTTLTTTKKIKTTSRKPNSTKKPIAVEVSTDKLDKPTTTKKPKVKTTKKHATEPTTHHPGKHQTTSTPKKKMMGRSALGIEATTGQPEKLATTTHKITKAPKTKKADHGTNSTHKTTKAPKTKKPDHATNTTHKTTKKPKTKKSGHATEPTHVPTREATAKPASATEPTSIPKKKMMGRSALGIEATTQHPDKKTATTHKPTKAPKTKKSDHATEPTTHHPEKHATTTHKSTKAPKTKKSDHGTEPTHKTTKAPKTKKSEHATEPTGKTTVKPTTATEPTINPKKKMVGKSAFLIEPTKKPKDTTHATTAKPHKIITQAPNACTKLTIHPNLCLKHHNCDYNCATRQCELTESKSIKIDKDSCKHHQCLLDLCGCRGCDLSYNSAEGYCASSKQICSEMKFYEGECARANQYYAHSGVLCKSGKKSQGNCQIEETLLAVNLGTKGADKKYLDSRNVTHLSDEGVPFDDFHKTRKTYMGLSKDQMNGLPKEDKAFYEATVHGEPSLGGDGRCLSYKVKVWQDGKYELAVKLADPTHGAKKHRMFNIKLNGIDVMTEIDVAEVKTGKSSGVEVFLNFEIFHKGTALLVKGFPEKRIAEGYLDVSFCYGQCRRTSEFHEYVVAGFSVVKFVNEKSLEAQTCAEHKGNACTSRKFVCQHNVVYGDALPLQDCTKAYFGQHDCSRQHAFYVNGGALCHNFEHSGGDCKIGETVTAVNLHGEKFGPDSRGIHYKSQKDVPPKDVHLTAKTKNAKTIKGADDLDKDLYLTSLYGDSHANNSNSPDNCIFWNIPVKHDGSYEISIKTAEFYYSVHGSRTFNVKINGNYVLQELDLLALADKNTAIDLILNFEVHGSKLHFRGFPMMPFKGMMKLEFCYGGCKTDEHNWMLGAFYVVRFANDKKTLKGI